MSIIIIKNNRLGTLMPRKPRLEMIEETQIKLLKTAREHFGRIGYADTVMDELTANAGLTRGALYHHYGNKKGLFFVVVKQLDTEMEQRLNAITLNINDPWQAFIERCHVYLKMAIEPEIQQIMLKDAAAVLNSEQLNSIHSVCILSIAAKLEELMTAGIIKKTSSNMLARLINSALLGAALWIAHNDDSQDALNISLDSTNTLLEGLKT